MTQTFIRNTWYVAATSDEVSQKPLARTVCNIKLALYRDDEQKVVALEDFCPHRGAPLSLGFVEDGKLVCGYHGLKMDRSGKVDSMPLQRVSAFPCITSYAVEERYGFIWFWPGDQDKADTSLIPVLHWAESDEWGYGGGLFNIACDYRLMIDNLMDLTHETYVHGTSIGQKEIDETPVSTKMEGKEVVTSRYMEGIMAPPFWQSALRANGLPDNELVDRWQICRFTLPSHIMIDVGVALAGNGGVDAPKEKKARSVVVDFITPETDTSIHYFWGMARQFRPDDKELTDTIREGQGKIFSEDLEILEQQQKNLIDYPDRDLLMLDIDAGGVQARRLISRVIKQENTND